MAKIRSGGLVGQISGSIGGNTFTRGPAGQVLRTRRVPTRLSGDRHLSPRAALSSLSTRWQTLPDDARAAWQNYADQHPVADVFGEKRALSGAQVFVKLNSRIMATGGEGIDYPPTVAPPPALTELYYQWEDDPESLLLFYSAEPQDGRFLEIRALVTASRGVTATRGKERQIFLQPLVSSGPIDVLPAITSVFGHTTASMNVFLFARVLDSQTGLVSGALRALPHIFDQLPLWSSYHVTMTVSQDSATDVSARDCLVLFDSFNVGTTTSSEMPVACFATHPAKRGEPVVCLFNGIIRAKWTGAMPPLNSQSNAAATSATPGVCQSQQFGEGQGIALATHSAADAVTLFIHR